MEFLIAIGGKIERSIVDYHPSLDFRKLVTSDSKDKIIECKVCYNDIFYPIPFKYSNISMNQFDILNHPYIIGLNVSPFKLYNLSNQKEFSLNSKTNEISEFLILDKSIIFNEFVLCKFGVEIVSFRISKIDLDFRNYISIEGVDDLNIISDFFKLKNKEKYKLNNFLKDGK